MSALTSPFLNTKVEPAQVVPNLFPGGLALAASTKIYANSIVAKNASGYAVPASASTALVVVGRALSTVDNSAGSAGALSINVEQGCFDYAMASAPNALTNADIGAIVYAQDDQTVSKTNQGGTLPVAGVFLGTFVPANSSTTRAIVQMGPSLLGSVGLGSAAPGFVRCVITSIAAYTAASGVITANANGAIATQDGLTLAAGDLVLLPAVSAGAGSIAAADVGPYVVTAVGTASTPFVLTRPSWWAQGAGIQPGYAISVALGTKWSGSTWKALCASGQIVGTNSPIMYPSVDKGTGAVGTQVTAIFAAPNAIATAVDATAAAAVKAVLVVGYGVGTLDFTGTGTDAIKYTVQNF